MKHFNCRLCVEDGAEFDNTLPEEIGSSLTKHSIYLIAVDDVDQRAYSPDYFLATVIHLYLCILPAAFIYQLMFHSYFFFYLN
jgi:hypothetical protein